MQKTLRHSAIATCPMTILAVLGHIGPLAAQESPPKFELTPYVAYRIGGEFEDQAGDETYKLSDSGAQGIMFNIRANYNGQWEVLYGRQQTEMTGGTSFDNFTVLELDAEYYHFGGTYQFDGEDTRPFVAMTLGLSRFDPEPSDLRTESYFSASFGGGVQFRATRRVGVRLEGRVFATIIDNDSAIFCGSAAEAAGCLIHVKGSLLTQWEARAGLVFRF